MASGDGVGITVFERPGVAVFLEKLAEFAEVIVFTAGMEGYAKPLTDTIDPTNLIDGRLYRGATVSTKHRQGPVLIRPTDFDTTTSAPNPTGFSTTSAEGFQAPYRGVKSQFSDVRFLYGYQLEKTGRGSRLQGSDGRITVLAWTKLDLTRGDHVKDLSVIGRDLSRTVGSNTSTGIITRRSHLSTGVLTHISVVISTSRKHNT